MQIKSLLEAPSKRLTHDADHQDPVVLSTRIRLARNLKGHSFPGWADRKARIEILKSCGKAFEAANALAKGKRYDMDELSDLEKLLLVERHLISRELTGVRGGAGVYVSEDQSCAIMVNEEDHLRIQMVRPGLALEEIWRDIDKLDSELEANLDFAFSPELGYLTACPTNVGTGMRASAMMHLPALVIAGQMEKVLRAVNQAGIAVRGLFGEGTDASGSVFQISNQQTLGTSEEQIIQTLGKFLADIIKHENNARAKLLEEEPFKLTDKMGRAFGILKNGHLISSAEAMNLLSLMRLAVDLGALAPEARPVIDKLFIDSQPGHIQCNLDREIEPAERDQFRAAHFREHFSDLGPLEFDKILHEN